MASSHRTCCCVGRGCCPIERYCIRFLWRDANNKQIELQRTVRKYTSPPCQKERPDWWVPDAACDPRDCWWDNREDFVSGFAICDKEKTFDNPLVMMFAGHQTGTDEWFLGAVAIGYPDPLHDEYFILSIDTIKFPEFGAGKGIFSSCPLEQFTFGFPPPFTFSRTCIGGEIGFSQGNARLSVLQVTMGKICGEPQKPEACCIPAEKDACNDLPPTVCKDLGGHPQGAGTVCDDIQCPITNLCDKNDCNQCADEYLITVTGLTLICPDDCSCLDNDAVLPLCRIGGGGGGFESCQWSCPGGVPDCGSAEFGCTPLGFTCTNGGIWTYIGGSVQLFFDSDVNGFVWLLQFQFGSVCGDIGVFTYRRGCSGEFDCPIGGYSFAGISKPPPIGCTYQAPQVTVIAA